MAWFNGEDRQMIQDLRTFLKEELSQNLKAVLDLAKRKPREFELSEEILGLRKRIVDLEVQESKIKEKHDREERELKHMIGLEKKRQEFEIDQSKRETTVKVREENLAADKDRFTQQMTFHEKRFTEEVKYLKDIMSDILKRLPDVSASLEVTKDGRRGK